VGYLYELNQLTAAINGMAVSPKSIQERMAQAYADHLANIDSGRLPDSLRENFRALRSRITAGETLQREEAIRAVTVKLSDEEAVGMALAITEMLNTIRQKCNGF